MRIDILGKRWGLRFVPNLGQDYGKCNPPDQKGKEICIQAGLPLEKLVETLLHETMHAGNWHLDEEFIRQLSIDQARILSRLDLIKHPT